MCVPVIISFNTRLISTRGIMSLGGKKRGIHVLIKTPIYKTQEAIRKRFEDRKKRLKRDKLQGKCESEHAGGTEQKGEEREREGKGVSNLLANCTEFRNCHVGGGRS